MSTNKVHHPYNPTNAVDTYYISTHKIEVKQRAQVSTACQQHGHCARVGSSGLLPECCEEREGAVNIVDSAGHREAAVSSGHCRACPDVFSSNSVYVDHAHVVLELRAPPP